MKPKKFSQIQIFWSRKFLLENFLGIKNFQAQENFSNWKFSVQKIPIFSNSHAFKLQHHDVGEGV